MPINFNAEDKSKCGNLIKFYSFLIFFNFLELIVSQKEDNDFFYSHD